MREYTKTLAIAAAIGLVPLSALSQTAPTSFPMAELEELKASIANIPQSVVSAEQARQMALIVLADAAERPQGDVEGLQLDQAIVQSLAELAGNDPEILAVGANLTAMEAGAESNLARVMRLARSASRTLDKLVLDNPDNGGVLLQRGTNALYAPRIAGRIRIAVADFEALLAPPFDLGISDRAYVQTLLAQSYAKANRKDEARDVLQGLVTADLPHWSSAAATLLKEL